MDFYRQLEISRSNFPLPLSFRLSPGCATRKESMAPSQRQPKSQYACQYPNCKSTFTREPDRSRHERDVHKAQKHFCNQPGCNHRGAVRKDVFENHMRLKHPQYSSTSCFRKLRYILINLIEYLDVPEDLQQIPEDSPKSQSPLQDNQILGKSSKNAWIGNALLLIIYFRG